MTAPALECHAGAVELGMLAVGAHYAPGLCPIVMHDIVLMVHTSILCSVCSVSLTLALQFSHHSQAGACMRFGCRHCLLLLVKGCTWQHICQQGLLQIRRCISNTVTASVGVTGLVWRCSTSGHVVTLTDIT